MSEMVEYVYQGGKNKADILFHTLLKLVGYNSYEHYIYVITDEFFRKEFNRMEMFTTEHMVEYILADIEIDIDNFTIEELTDEIFVAMLVTCCIKDEYWNDHRKQAKYFIDNIG